MVEAQVAAQQPPTNNTKDPYAEDVGKTRDKLRVLREQLVKRCMQRTAEGHAAELRVRPDQYAPPLEAGQWEMQLLRMVVTCMLDPASPVPVDVDAMHRRLLHGAMGPDYERCLAAMGYNGPQPLLARLCGDRLLEAVHLLVGPRTGGTPRRMFIIQLDRPALARLAGVEDTLAATLLAQQAQQPLAGALMGLPGMLPPGITQPIMPGILPGAPTPPGGMPGQGPPQQPPPFMQVPMPPITGGPPGMGPPGVAQGGGPPHDGMPPILPMPPQGSGPAGQGGEGGPHGHGGPNPPPGGPPGDGDRGHKRGADMDLDSLLSRKTQRDRLTLDRGGAAELQAVLAKPTAREAAQLEAFRTAGGQSAIQEHCPHLTKEDCRRANNSPVACPRLHFRRLIFPHTDPSLGNCSYLNTCRNFRNCKYIHYEIDEDEDVHNNMMMMGGGPGMAPMMGGPGMMMGGPGGMPGMMMPPPGGLMGGPAAAMMMAAGQQAKQPPPVPKYLQALAQPQWIQCDIRTLDMKVLGKFGVIMADPPWRIHQDLPYGTMEDDEMRRMDIGCLQDHGVIFLWVTGRAMELARECLKIWGYDRVDELIWVKTNQLNRLIRTGRTGHWLNHSKEHCLIGVKGKPALNKYVDCDVVVAEVRETSRKPDEMYTLLERLSPGTRKLEIFARSHNLTQGWVGLGNQLDGVNIADPEMKERFIARYGPPGPDGKLPLPF